jgi:phosphotriesterase-related protein
MSVLWTTIGPISQEKLGLILPHEHIFVDLRHPAPADFGQAEAEDVVTLMAPEVTRAHAAGVTALVECTPVGVGRRADLVHAVAEATNFPIVVPTGIYREPWVPEWAYKASEDELYAWMRAELDEGIRGACVRAGFVKVSAGDDGITAVETKILRAAARAALPSGAAIASHTVRGRVVADQLAILAGCGFPAERFIWVHTQNEPHFAIHLEIARRGAWVEYDNIGWGEDEPHIERIQRIIEAGFAHQLLISHDRGWYTPAEQGGGTPKPFTYITETFLPKLRAAGVDESIIRQITVTNPFNAFAH